MVITLEPLGASLTGKPGETLLAAARRSGLLWRSVCDGHAECRTCFFTTTTPEAFAPAAALELAALATIAPVVSGHGDTRLACQARIVGSGAARKIGVRTGQLPSS